MNSLTFDGVNSAVYKMIIGGGGTFNAPERDVTSVEIPGRNGALTIDNGRYKNIVVKYPVFILENFANNAAAVRAWLMSASGYKRLTDSYDPAHYRKARFLGPVEWQTSSLHMYGEGVLSFDCMPQRFLISGDTPEVITTSGTTITNETLFDALPVIEVEGTGDIMLSVGGYTVGITGLQSKITIDCELQECYNGAQNLNNSVSVVDFPKLIHGQNIVGWVGNVSKVTVTPRWWTL